MLAAYFDDSGTHGDSRTVVWGGFLGTCEQWASLDKAWRQKLANPLQGKPALKKFGLADCQGRHEEFSSYSRAESDLLQHEFRQIILDSGVVGLAYAIDRQAWEKTKTKKAEDLFGDAETVCFSACFNGAIERAEQYWPEDLMLSLHFDRGRKCPKLSGVIDKVRKNYYGAPALVNMSFNPVAGFPPLQAADIIATEHYWHANLIITGGGEVRRPHFTHFLQRVHAQGYIMEEREILNIFKHHGV